jgi:TolB-like protein
MSLLRELQRRNVIRVATAYVVTAWLVIQVVETIFPAFGFGDQAIRLAVIVFGIGFIPAVIGAWVFEWTPEGLKRDDGEEAAPGRGRNVDRAIVVILALGIVYFAFDKFVLAPERAAEREAVVAEQAAEEARKGFYGDRSIAVLPFDNLSSDPEQVYFVDGVAEEILNLLARIRDLRVISRSSSFAVRGQGLEIPDIAERLDVAHVLEGSVRRAGNRVRVTAQLIEARTDTHLWSKTYERELDNVFQIQDEIAADVAKNLEITLLSPLPHSRNVHPEAYALVQQVSQIFQVRGKGTAARMYPLAKRALELDPDYPEAVKWLIYAEWMRGLEGLISWGEANSKIELLESRYAELAPDSGFLEASKAFELEQGGQLEKAATFYLRALEKEMTDSE